MIQEIISSDAPVSVKRAAELVYVSSSGYYKWTSREIDPIKVQENDSILKEIKDILGTYAGYGYRRVERELRRRGFVVNHKKVLRIMRKNKLIFIRKRKKVITTDSNHTHKRYPNLIEGLKITRPNQIWASDITYIRLNDGFAYLAVILDLYGRRCIGWALARYLDSRLTLEALNKAFETRKGANLVGLIHHSDQGVQYASDEYIQALMQREIQISMSRTANPYDNAFVESFIKTLKVEEVYLNEYETFEDALKNIKDFIEEVYNKKRLHSSLGYKTPIEFEQEVALNIVVASNCLTHCPP
jgi:transposase InsO family protein